MTDHETHELSAEFRDFAVDIGRDGGELSFTYTPRRYWINGARVSEREAWVWIWRWHWLRDRMELEPCSCEPCVWYRMELERLCPAVQVRPPA